jgi:hypothetical protein
MNRQASTVLDEVEETGQARASQTPASGVMVYVAKNVNIYVSRRSGSPRWVTRGSTSADVISLGGTSGFIDQSTKFDSIEEVTPTVPTDTQTPFTVAQMAATLQAVTQPTKHESVPLSFDPDDYPLF